MVLTLANANSLTILGAAMLLGVLLLAAIALGLGARRARAPRVIGYLLAGLIAKIVLDWAIRTDPNATFPRALLDAADYLEPIKNLALGLILFSIGGVFEARQLRLVGRHIMPIAWRESGLTALLVTGVVAGVVLITNPQLSAGRVLCFALLLGLAAQATAPAATIFVLREYDAKGPTTNTVLALVGINNVLCIVTFHVVFIILAATGALGQASARPAANLWVDLPVVTLGSVLLGVAAGLTISVVHARMAPTETIAVLVALLLMLGAGEHWLLEHEFPSYNFLLTCIAMGAVFANISLDPQRLDGVLRTIAHPILIGFFVLAGFDLHLNDLLHLGWLGAAYVAARTAGKVVGAWLGVRRIGRSGGVQPYLGAGLLCQAAVVIGLAHFVERYWADPWASRSFGVTVLGSVAIFELVGPMLTKWMSVRAGEVKAVTLLRRGGTGGAGLGATIMQTLSALGRTVGLGRPRSTDEIHELTVSQLMRTNVKCLNAAAGFDDVLRFIEQSHHNDFPVIDDEGEFVGLIRYRDIREMMYEPTLSHLLTALDLANPVFAPLPADMPLDEALKVFRRRDVGLLAVVEDAESKRVIGVLEQRDVLRAFHIMRAT